MWLVDFIDEVVSFACCRWIWLGDFIGDVVHLCCRWIWLVDFIDEVARMNRTISVLVDVMAIEIVACGNSLASAHN